MKTIVRPLSSNLTGLAAIPAVLIFLTSCSGTFLPTDGPGQHIVMSSAELRSGDVGSGKSLIYALVPIDAQSVSRLASDDDVARFDQTLTGSPAGAGGIGVGDLVGVTVFESGAGGLFIPTEPGTRTSNSVTLPVQQVNNSGNITIPFAGVVHVAGQDPQAVAHVIETRLSDRALDPQAIVTVQERRSRSISVTGEVATSTHFSLDPGGERLLGAISRAGGPKFPAYETAVTLLRGNQNAKALLSEVMNDPKQNIQLQPGDTISLSHTPRYFLALGALGPGQYLGLINRRLSFDDSRLSLADGIAKVGGLEDDRANPRAVFVYRFEDRQALAALGVSTPSPPPTLPTVYALDLAEPAGYFYAKRFMLRNEDLVFVSNAPSTDLAKLLALILPAAYSVSNFRN